MIALALLAASVPLGAQSAPPAEPAPEPAPVEELARLVEEQRRLIEAQQRALAEQQQKLAEQQQALAEQQQRLTNQQAKLTEQEKRLAELEQRLEEASLLALATSNEVAEIRKLPVEESVAAAVEARLAEVEQTVQRVPEMAVQNLQGEFPGSFKIPGTDAALRIGGRVRVVFIDSFDAIGSDDRFITSSIPVEGSEEAGKTSRVEFSVIPSRFNFDLRTPTGVGYMRAYIEADFAGSSNQLRLRHAFGQWDRWLVGQSWSTFSDPEAEPDGIDFEGLNAISMVRQPQVRWTRPIGERLSFAVAAEEANPDLTGAEGVNQAPDLILRLRWDPKEAPLFGFGLLREGSHIQTSLLFRQLRGEVESPTGEPIDTLSTAGYGINLSGVLPAPWAPERDRIRFAWNAGKGIGRYITDLSTDGGQDAFFDEEAGELVALPVGSSYIGLEHWWNERLRSTLTTGFVWVDTLDAQPGDALERTQRFSLNLSYSPIPRLDIVAEYLWGRRINRDGQSGKAGQVQLGSAFRF